MPLHFHDYRNKHVEIKGKTVHIPVYKVKLRVFRPQNCFYHKGLSHMITCSLEQRPACAEDLMKNGVLTQIADLNHIIYYRLEP